MSTWKIAFLFALISGFMMIGCPEDEPYTDDDDDDSAPGDDDDATADDDDSAPGDDDDATAGDDDDTVAGEPDIQTQPQNLDFGTVSVGSTADIALDIRNLGDAPLEINNMASALSQLNYTPFTGPIQPGGTQTVLITAVCTVEEEVDGGLVITSNDPDESPLHIVTMITCDEV
jgi:hypothetical protein